MEATAKLYSLNLHNTRTYLFALFFVAGNIIVPQLCHLITNGGISPKAICKAGMGRFHT